jgi:phage protein D
MAATPLAIEQDIFVGQDFYVPAFKVKARGKELVQVESDVLSVTYTDTDNRDEKKQQQMDSFDLTVNNWDPDGKGLGLGWFKYSDRDTFNPWQDVELFMGYYRKGSDELARMLVGEIVRMTPSFTESGASTLTVHCVNLLQRFRTIQVTKDYVQKKDSWIARDLVQEIAKQVRQAVPSLELQLDDDEINRNLANESEIQHLVVQRQYAINFLLDRSREIGYDLWLDLDEDPTTSRRLVTLHYAPSKYVLKPTYVIEWGKSLVSFQPSFATTNLPDQVIVRSWNPTLKKKFEGKASRTDLQNDNVIDPTADMKVQQGPLAKKTEIVTNLVVQSDDEARDLAHKRLLRLAQRMIQGKGKTLGLPDLRSGRKVRIKGLGRFSGLYAVNTTTHTIGDTGYTTDFTATMEMALGDDQSLSSDPS